MWFSLWNKRSCIFVISLILYVCNSLIWRDKENVLVINIFIIVIYDMSMLILNEGVLIRV